jgi:glycine cleavage system regulatory protein
LWEALLSQRVILTVVGSDRPGLTQALADAVLAAGGNWLESHLARLGGKYVGSVLVELAPERRAELEAACRAVDSAGLQVTLVEAGPAEERATTVSLELVGRDRPGIVREITAALAALQVNIEELDTALEREAWSGESLFRLRAELATPPSVTLDAVRDALEAISGEIMVDFNLVRPLGR